MKKVGKTFYCQLKSSVFFRSVKLNTSTIFALLYIYEYYTKYIFISLYIYNIYTYIYIYIYMNIIYIYILDR